MAFQCLYVKAVKMGMGRRGESEDCLASCMQMTWFCVVCRKKTKGQWWDVLPRCVGVGGLKVNAGKSNVMVLDGEERWEYKVWVDGM